MLADTLNNIQRDAKEAATNLVWRQWSMLTPMVAAEIKGSTSVIDPEALVLASVCLFPDEKRLEEIVASWFTVGAHLLSVQRMKSIAKLFPDSYGESFIKIAELIGSHGSKRWGTHSNKAVSTVSETSQTKDPGALRLQSSQAIMLRLRAGMGVGVKADTLSFLITTSGQPKGIRETVFACSYTDRAIRTALHDMTQAGFVDRYAQRSLTYTADAQRWCEFLMGSKIRPPSWGYSAHRLSFYLHVAAWAESAQKAGWSEYVVASRGRDLLEKFQPFFEVTRHHVDFKKQESPISLIQDAYDVVSKAA